MPDDLNIFSERIVQSIGWGLIDSFWIGLFGYLFLRILLLLVDERNSELRYILSSAVFTTIFVLFINSIFSHFKSSGTLQAGYIILDIKRNSLFDLSLQYQNFEVLLNLLHQGFIYLQNNMYLLVLMWLSGILFYSIKLISAFYETISLKSELFLKKNKSLTNNLDILIAKIRSEKKIEIWESCKVNIPSVAGIINPVILFPLGFTTQLTGEQIQLIIAHELAHIRRLDPLIKLFQSIIELILFFNPFIWSISKIINNERENSCDDFALKLIDSPISLSRALLAVAELNEDSLKFAMNLSGQKNTLLKRVSRIMGITFRNEYSFKNYLVAVLLVTVIILGIFGFSLLNIPANTSEQNIKNHINNSTMASINNSDELIRLLDYKFGGIEKTSPVKVISESSIPVNKLKSGITGSKEPRRYNDLAEKLNLLFDSEEIMQSFDNVIVSDTLNFDFTIDDKMYDELNISAALNEIAQPDFKLSLEFDFKQVKLSVDQLKINLDE